MEHFDWVGFGIFITLVGNVVIGIMAAIQRWRMGKEIKEIHSKVDGLTDQLVEQSHYTGVLEGSIDPVRPHDAPPGPSHGP